ncbi:MAG: hypothetical protein RL551_850 [Pseudomonadota bacterium]
MGGFSRTGLKLRSSPDLGYFMDFSHGIFPLPPLDGGRILSSLLPARQSIAFGKLEPWGFFIVLGLVFTGIIGNLWMEPLTAFFKYLIYLITLPIQMLI